MHDLDCTLNTIDRQSLVFRGYLIGLPAGFAIGFFVASLLN